MTVELRLLELALFIPLVTFFTMKLGTYAFYRARYLFEQDIQVHEKKEECE